MKHSMRLAFLFLTILLMVECRPVQLAADAPSDHPARINASRAKQAENATDAGGIKKRQQRSTEKSELRLENVTFVGDRNPYFTIRQLDNIARQYLKTHPMDFDLQQSKSSMTVFSQGLENRASMTFESTIKGDRRRLHIWISQQGQVRQVKIDTPETSEPY